MTGGKHKYQKVINIEETISSEVSSKLDGNFVVIDSDTVLTEKDHKGKTLLCYNDIILYLPANPVSFWCIVRNKDGERKEYQTTAGAITNCDVLENVEINTSHLIEVDTLLPVSIVTGFNFLSHYHIE